LIVVSYGGYGWGAIGGWERKLQFGKFLVH